MKKYTDFQIRMALDRALQDSYMDGIKTGYQKKIGSIGYNEYIKERLFHYLDSQLQTINQKEE